MSDSLWPHGLQHARLSCPSPPPRVCSNACPLCWWWHPTILSSGAAFSSHLQSFPASGSFPMSQLFTSGGQSTGASASASVLLIWSRLISFRTDWFDLQCNLYTVKFIYLSVWFHGFFINLQSCMMITTVITPLDSIHILVAYYSACLIWTLPFWLVLHWFVLTSIKVCIIRLLFIKTYCSLSFVFFPLLDYKSFKGP